MNHKNTPNIKNLIVSIFNFKLFIFNSSGQALVVLLVFAVIAITITSAAIIIIITNSLSTTKYQQGVDSYYIAESGAENALLRLLRDPNYTGTGYLGEPPLTVGSNTVTISVSGSPNKTITATSNGAFVRTVQVVTTYTNNKLTIVSWKEL